MSGPYDRTDPPWQPAQQPGQQSYLPPPSGGDGAGGGRKRSWPARHKILTGLLAVVGVLVLFGIIGAIAGTGTPTDPGAVSPSAPVVTVVPTTEAPDPTTDPPTTEPTTDPAPPVEVTTKAAPKPPAAPELTTSQKQAIGSAEDYLKFQPFSKLGLIDQLSSSAGEGFSRADATFAVNHITVDWKEQAVKSARQYLEFEHFSRSGLIQQLSSSAGEKFTRAEATYAADKVGL